MKEESELIKSIFGSEANLLRMRIYEILQKDKGIRDRDTELLELCRKGYMSKEDVAAAVHGRVVYAPMSADFFVKDMGDLYDTCEVLSSNFKAGSLLGLFQGVSWVGEQGLATQFEVEFTQIVPKVLKSCDDHTISLTQSSPYKNEYEQKLLPLVKDYPRGKSGNIGSRVAQSLLLMENLNKVLTEKGWTSDDKLPEIVRQVADQLFYGVTQPLSAAGRVRCMAYFRNSFAPGN